MDIFIGTFEKEYDLDDQSIYPEEWKTIPIYKLWRKCWTAAGESLFYMQYFHPDIDFGEQVN